MITSLTIMNGNITTTNSSDGGGIGPGYATGSALSRIDKLSQSSANLMFSVEKDRRDPHQPVLNVSLCT
jgi:hypothetical protein